jgi:hypothetical protein
LNKIAHDARSPKLVRHAATALCASSFESPYGVVAASGVVSFCGAISGAPKISALEASTKCACGALDRTASSRFSVPSPFARTLPAGSRNDSATLDWPAR